MNIKKKIAKEGLILLGFAALGLVIYFIGKHLNNTYLLTHQEVKFKVIKNMRYALIGYTPYLTVKNFGLGICALGYPLFAIFRFIFWAIKTLKVNKVTERETVSL